MSLPIPTAPAALGSIYLSNANGTLQLPNYFDVGEISREIMNELRQIPGRDGAVSLRDAHYGLMSGSIVGHHAAANSTTFRSDVADILEKLREGDVKLFIGGTAVTDRYLEIKPTSTSTRAAQERTHGRVSIPFDVATPYWLENQTTANGSQSGQPKGQTVTNNGDAPVIPDSWVFTGFSTANTYDVSNDTTGESFAFTTVATPDSSRTISQVTMTSVDGVSTNKIQEIDDNEFFYAPIRLLPGNNTITTTGASGWSLAITWRERFHI